MKYRIREQNELKPSGVEWLGDIPKDWATKKIKYLFNIGRGRVIAQPELEDDGIYPVYSSQTKNDGILGYIKTYDFDCNQLTWTTDGANAGTVFLREGKHNCTNVCGTLQQKNDNFILKYLLFALQKVAPSHKRPDTNGAKIMNGEMAEIKVTFPSKIEQQKIAHFVDEKNKIFNDAIAKKEQLIDKLELAKQALISEVVTGKLKVVENNSKQHTIKRNPNELKPSGVAWLGDIPKEWQVKKLKYFTQKITSGSTPLGGSETYLDEGVPLLRSQNIHYKGLSLDNVAYISHEVHNQMRRSKLQEKDILINITGASIGRISYVPVGFEDGNVNQHVCIIRINHKMAYYKYISLFLSTNLGQDQVFINQVGTSREGLSFEDLNNFNVIFPTLAEQQQISKYLDEKLIHFDNTIAKTKQSITKLKEAKEALISEAVTGKIEVIEEESKANEYFQRRVLAAYFIDKSQNDLYFGRVKLQKMLYMAEAVNHLDFKSDYHRHAMGPLDPIMLHSIESQLKKAKWFEARKIKNGRFEKVEYRALENHAEYLRYLDGRYWKQENIDYIFNLMKGMKTQQAEIVATIHNAYIDLSKENRVSQENLLDEILNHWHDNKKNIPQENWLKAIEWMCEKRLIEL